MSNKVAVGLSESYDPVEAFSDAAAEAARGLDAPCDLCVLFASAPHVGHGKWILSTVHDALGPANLIGCGAGGVVGEGREVEEGPGAVVWAASMPGARIETHHMRPEPEGDDAAIAELVAGDGLGDCMIMLADPYTVAAESLLAQLNRHRPGLPVLGGLASAGMAGGGMLFRDGDVLNEGAAACSLTGVSVLPCVSQGAAPVGPEMTITAAEGNVIEELASRPAVERLAEAIAELPQRDRDLAREGLMLGLVIDENQPEYGRGDFLARPIIGADQDAGTVVIGERVGIGQTVRIHVRDAASADEDLREALAAQSEALGPGGAAGALLFTCNGRGSHMFSLPDHDALAIEDTLGAPAGGFFCAGEIGPVGGRNFLHGFTATMAVFPASDN
jgi:small ligand-binding sensory domain FIST